MTDRPQSIVVLARMAMLGTLFFALVMYVAFVFIQPELNPVHRFGSEYSVGRMGWLMKAAFFVWGGGLLALALAMAKGLDTASRSRTAIILLAVGGVGVFFAGVFDSDLQVLNENPPPTWVEAPASDEQLLHDAAGMVGLLSRRASQHVVYSLPGGLGPSTAHCGCYPGSRRLRLLPSRSFLSRMDWRDWPVRKPPEFLPRVRAIAYPQASVAVTVT